MEINSTICEQNDTNYNKGIAISRRKNFYYKGIQRTLKKDVIYNLDYNEKIEYSKCASDILYFVETYLGIEFKPYQLEWLKAYQENKFNLMMLCRMSGLSFIFSIIYLHEMIFLGKSITLIGKYKDRIIESLKLFYIKLPYFIKPGIVLWSNDKVCFNNGSRIKFQKEFILFSNCDIIHILAYSDEIIRYIVPIISGLKNCKMIITETGNEDMYEFYIDCKRKKNEFKITKTYWWDMNNDDSWKEEQITMMGKDTFKKEYELQFIKNKK